MDNRVFRVFIYIAVPVVLVIIYERIMPAEDSSDIKSIVADVAQELAAVNRKHANLKNEMDRITSSLPVIASSAGHAKQAMQAHFHAFVTPENYDRQIVDYALETAGGRIVDTGETVDHINYETSISYLLHCLAAMFCRGCLNARAIINPGTLPGQCWAFKGQCGEATIRLLGTVYVTGVSLEHIAPEISPTREISMAPRLFQLQGLERKSDMYPHDFGTFEYNKDGPPIQYFEVKNPATKGYYLVRMKILGNWGHPVYTCVYRVRIHGELVHGQLPHSTKSDLSDGLQIENE